MGFSGDGGVVIVKKEIQIWISIFACLFLTTYGVMRLNSALNPVGMEVNLEETKSVKTTIMAGLGFTYLNPHVYVDTLLLIGGASSRYVGDEQLFFGLGAASASFIFFFSSFGSSCSDLHTKQSGLMPNDLSSFTEC